jgi:L-ascorbate metabolism protein UlaG (beta-lactamase superfamily)
MKITKYVHATFEIETNNIRILIDPGKYTFDGGRFNLGKMSPNYFNNIDILILTHTHADHYDPEAVIQINKNPNLKIISNSEVGKDLKQKGIEHIVMGFGDTKSIEGIEFKAYKCDHIVPAIGLTINDGKNIIYYVSDSLYKEPDTKADILLVPIGNRNLVMSPEEAAVFTNRLKPKLVIPMHYESPKDEVMPEEFLKELRKLNDNTKVKILDYKESYNIN